MSHRRAAVLAWLLLAVSGVASAWPADASVGALDPPPGTASMELEPTTETPGSPAAAEPPAEPPADPIVDLETLVVSGAQPGPGLWTVRSGAHELRILGTVTPLPRRMEWTSAEVEAAIAAAGVVIAPPAVTVDADVGFFRGMALVPALLRARNNPGGRTLAEAVGPELHARWAVLKARYMGRDRGVEKRRPLVAAQELYEAALKRSGLVDGGIVEPVLRRARRAAGVPLVDTVVRVRVEDPRGALRELAESDLADHACFAGTLDRIESDLESMRARANAWAVGDIEALRALPHGDHRIACQDAVTGSALAQRLGIHDLPERARAAWLENAEEALREHPSSFAILPMHHLLGDDGLLARLRARGYAVEAP